LRAIIFANGGFTYPPPLLPGDLLIAADGGARHCLDCGLTPTVIVGDFDSVDPQTLLQLHAAGSEFVRYPTRKDFTDLELALQHAIQRGADEILVLAALGGRWDQTLANLLLPAASSMAGICIRLVDGNQEILIVHPDETLTIQGQPGDIVSLIPLAGDAHEIITHGLEYPLQAESLAFGSTRGVSNVLVEETATISLNAGMLMVILIHADSQMEGYQL
jgi:thiamine pyrophosphokinase